MSAILLEVITPKGVYEKLKCDSVHFNISDNLKGKNGGSYGVRSGHAKAIFSLEAGLTKAYLNGNLVFCVECGNGFATVNDNLVTLIVENVLEK